ncbi:SET domain - like 10, partial [Theobroma cacao]
NNFCKVSCNANAIVDIAMEPLGIGLYPVMSIINHSCLPNAILVFEGKLAVLRALVPVEKDLGRTTRYRQDDLNAKYHCLCLCRRCCKFDEIDDQILDALQCKHGKCDGFLVDKDGFYGRDQKLECSKCGRVRTSKAEKRAKEKLEPLLAKGRSDFANRNFQEALSTYKRVEEATLDLYHPSSFSVMIVRNLLTKLYMKTGDIQAALECCRLTTPDYYKHKILFLECTTTHEGCLNGNILRITHGTNFPLLSCNAHAIVDIEMEQLGIGLYPVMSIINHSCLPNAVLVFEGKLAVLRAIAPVDEGDEVLISYIDLGRTTRFRQDDLNGKYHFTCSCPRCCKFAKIDDQILDALGCKNGKCDGFLVDKYGLLQGHDPVLGRHYYTRGMLECCLPNAILVFEGKLAVLRALAPVEKGDEVLISYIDLSRTTRHRQDDLNGKYHFTCTCPRCSKFAEIDDQILDALRCKEGECNGFFVTKDRSYSRDQKLECNKCGLIKTSEAERSAKGIIDRLCDKGKSDFFSDNFQEAVSTFKRAEEAALDLFHPSSFSVMMVRNLLTKLYTTIGDTRAALESCRLMTPVHERLLQTLNPVRGMHYLTRGMLEWVEGNRGDGRNYLVRAGDILLLTHGTNFPLVKELLINLAKDHAELAKKQEGGPSGS